LLAQAVEGRANISVSSANSVLANRGRLCINRIALQAALTHKSTNKIKTSSEEYLIENIDTLQNLLPSLNKPLFTQVGHIMTSQPTLTGASLATNQWSPEGSQASDASLDAPTGCMTPPGPAECSQTNIEADIKIITAYLVKEGAPAAVQAARWTESATRMEDASNRRLWSRRFASFKLSSRNWLTK
jgi:hypothetical protein